MCIWRCMTDSNTAILLIRRCDDELQPQNLSYSAVGITTREWIDLSTAERVMGACHPELIADTAVRGLRRSPQIASKRHADKQRSEQEHRSVLRVSGLLGIGV